MATTDTIAKIKNEMEAQETAFTNTQTALETNLASAKTELATAEAELNAADPTASDFGDKVQAVTNGRVKVELLTERVAAHKALPVFTVAEFNAYASRIYAVVQKADTSAKSTVSSALSSASSAIGTVISTESEAEELFNAHRGHADTTGHGMWIYDSGSVCNYYLGNDVDNLIERVNE